MGLSHIKASQLISVKNDSCSVQGGGFEVDSNKAREYIKSFESRGRHTNIDTNLSVVEQLRLAGFAFTEERFNRLMSS